MTDRPIIFSGPMVRALLEGRKTMTRRLVRQPEQTKTGHWNIRGIGGGCVLVGNATEEEIGYALLDYAPYAVGDRLYVRETWRPINSGDISQGAEFLADKADGWRDQTVWRPAIHHPKAWSRTTLTVTAVKVERLQDISERDARAEGTHGYRMLEGIPAFRAIWEDLNAKRAPWDSNPWIVAVLFEVAKINIDKKP